MSKSNVNLLETLLREKGRLDGRPFSDLEIEQFLKYYQIVLQWNPRLHLTTLSEPESFFERHIRESEFAETLISPAVSEIWDLGSGLGVPGVPLAILRKDLSVNLVESGRRKAIFLEEATAFIGLNNVAVLNSRIEKLKLLPPSSGLTARAVEQMEELIPEMLKIGVNCSQILFFGSGELAKTIQEEVAENFSAAIHPLPDSDRRFLIGLTRST